MTLQERAKEEARAHALAGSLSLDHGNACGREKYWSECSIEEKIERTRQQTKSQQESIARIGDTVASLVRQFGIHQHGDRGVILIPLDALEMLQKEVQSALGYIRVRREDNQEVYF